MNRPVHPHRELALLFGLLLLLLVTATLSHEKSQEIRQPNEPSTFNAKPNGLKALYLLYQKQNYAVTQLRRNWTNIGSETALLFVVEPLESSRAVSKEEIVSLKRWVEQGGTLVYIATAPERPYDPKDPLMGDIAITSGTATPYTIEPTDTTSPYLKGVDNVAYTSPVRLKTRKNTPYTALIEDPEGGLLLHRRLGNGNLLVSTIADLASNTLLSNEEYGNLPLVVNIAQEATKAQKGSIAFDEYHHGIGFDDNTPAGKEGVWGVVPIPLKLALLHLILVGGFVLYSGNRRFGHPLPLNVANLRPSTDYATALAGFWRRSKAGDIAFLILYDKFLSDLARLLNAPNSLPETLLPLVQSHQPTVGGELQAIFAEGEEIRAGKRIKEEEMFGLVQRVENLRRAIPLVG